MKRTLFAFAATLALATGAYAAPLTQTSTHAVTTTHTAAPAARLPASSPPAAGTHAASTNIAADASASGELSCHTHHRAGQSCMCLKAPSRRGAAELKSGHNMCVVPPAHNHA